MAGSMTQTKKPRRLWRLGLLAVCMFAIGYEQSISGGAGGIRTRGGLLTLTRFPGVRLKPLIHLSGKSAIVAGSFAHHPD